MADLSTYGVHHRFHPLMDVFRIYSEQVHNSPHAPAGHHRGMKLRGTIAARHWAAGHFHTRLQGA